MDAFTNLINAYENSPITMTTIWAVLIAAAILAVYEFVVYRFVSHRAFYNKSFNIALAILPFFISTIILCLQSNVVITLGTIGALAIIRFRTAVKDPVDMIYLLWSIHTGICCGCQLYPVAVITSVVVTLIMLLLNQINFGRKPFVVVIHAKRNAEDIITKVVKRHCKSFRIKSRNFSMNGVDYAIEANIKDTAKLCDELRGVRKIDRFSVIEYDPDDIV